MRTHRTAAAAAAVGLLATALGTTGTPVAAATWVAPTFQTTIGQPGHAGVYAWGMATAADGTILVGDYWNYAIRRFAPDGTLLQTISSKGGGLGQNKGAHGVAVDPRDGSFYLADFNNPYQIDKWDADGTPRLSFITYVPNVTVPYPYITRVAVNSQGLVYAVSSHNYAPGSTFSKIVVFNPDGTYRSSFGSFGSGAEDLGLTRGIAIGPDDEVYLANVTRQEIQVYAADGTYLRSFGNGRFSGDMRGLAVDAANRWLYAIDSSGSQVEKFTLAGEHLTTWGSEGTGPGQFRDGGRELTVGRDGTVYAADFGNNRVNVYAPDGTFLRDFPSPPIPPRPDGFNQAQDVAVSADGQTIMTADTYNHRVQQWRPDGTVVRTWGFRGTTAPDALNYPRGVALDPTSGDVLVVNSRQGNVKRYTANGAFVRQFGSWGSQPGQMLLPRGAWVAPDGRITVGDSNNRRVTAFSPSGDVLWSVPCGRGPQIGVGPAVLSGCTGVAGDTEGNTYAAAVTEHAVYKFSPTGVLLAKWGTLGSAAGQLRGPYDVAVHDGRVYVTEMNNNRVSVFTTAGQYEGRFATKGSGDGQVSSPRGIDIDANGRIYVMDGNNERLVVFQQ